MSPVDVTKLREASSSPIDATCTNSSAYSLIGGPATVPVASRPVPEVPESPPRSTLHGFWAGRDSALAMAIERERRAEPEPKRGPGRGPASRRPSAGVRTPVLHMAAGNAAVARRALQRLPLDPVHAVRADGLQGADWRARMLEYKDQVLEPE